jgi:hypothetical protein
VPEIITSAQADGRQINDVAAIVVAVIIENSFDVIVIVFKIAPPESGARYLLV